LSIVGCMAVHFRPLGHARNIASSRPGPARRSNPGVGRTRPGLETRRTAGRNILSAEGSGSPSRIGIPGQGMAFRTGAVMAVGGLSHRTGCPARTLRPWVADVLPQGGTARTLGPWVAWTHFRSFALVRDELIWACIARSVPAHRTATSLASSSRVPNSQASSPNIVMNFEFNELPILGTYLIPTNTCIAGRADFTTRNPNFFRGSRSAGGGRGGSSACACSPPAG
jgi:hypothetical protein